MTLREVNENTGIPDESKEIRSRGVVTHPEFYNEAMPILWQSWFDRSD